MNLYDFLGQFQRSGSRRGFYFGREGVSIYLRDLPRIIDGLGHKAITLADINVDAPLRGQGIFRCLLAEAEVYCIEHGLTLFIENVVTPRFADFFRRRGYHELPDLTPSFFKRHG